MFYDFAIAVAAGTTEANPVEQLLDLTYGVIHRIEVRFRRGTDFRVGCRIYYREHQIYPTNIDEDFREDGRPIAFDTHFEMFEPPHTLKIRAYSPTAIHPHTIYVRIGILPEKVLSPWAQLGKAIRGLLPGFGRS